VCGMILGFILKNVSLIKQKN
ncbi:rhomboid family intramembrane serine protease, partial [Klebsiella pneumoniae]|nr:rhomboid family intramembrane serine protease [Klebsiella pneumoniae]